MKKIRDIKNEIALLQDELNELTKKLENSVKVYYNGTHFVLVRDDNYKAIVKTKRNPKEERQVFLWDDEKIIGQIHLNNQMQIKNLKIWFAEFDEPTLKEHIYKPIVPSDFFENFDANFKEQIVL